MVVASSSGTSRPPAPSTTIRSHRFLRVRKAARMAATSMLTPAMRAQTAGARGGSRTYGAPQRAAGTPAAARRKARSSAPSAAPVWTGFIAPTLRPAAPRARATAAAITVLPTPVPVPVTNTPPARRMRGSGPDCSVRSAGAGVPGGDSSGQRASGARKVRRTSEPTGPRTSGRTEANASRARSRCSPVCPAVRVTRSRAVPGGTDGGRMAGTKTPASSSRAERAIASAPSPASTGTMAAAGGSTRYPSDARRIETRRPQRPGPPVRLRPADTEGLPGGSDRGGRWGGVEDVAAGAVAEPLDEVVGARDEAPRRPESLGKRRHDDADPSREAGGLDRPCAPAPQQPGGVGLVHHQHGAPAVADLGDGAEGGHVPVHREDGVGDDQPPPGGDLGQQAIEVADVGVPVHDHPGSRQPAPVDDAGVVQLVGEDRVLPPGEGCDGAEVGQVSGREQDCLLASLVARQVSLEGAVQLAGAGDEPGSPRSCSPPQRRLPGRPAEARVACEAEVVVRAELQDPSAPDHDLGAGGARQRHRVAAEPPGLEPLQLGGDPAHRVAHRALFSKTHS